MNITDLAMAKAVAGGGSSPYPGYPKLVYSYTHTGNP
jgi:hypothetical protein